MANHAVIVGVRLVLYTLLAYMKLQLKGEICGVQTVVACIWVTIITDLFSLFLLFN